MKKKSALLLTIIPFLIGCSLASPTNTNGNNNTNNNDSGTNQNTDNNNSDNGNNEPPSTDPSSGEDGEPVAADVYKEEIAKDSLENKTPKDTSVDANHPDEDIIASGLSYKLATFKKFFNPQNDVHIEIKLTNDVAYKTARYGIKDKNDMDDGVFAEHGYLRSEMYHPCTVKISINNETNTYYEAGLRLKGNLSRKDGDFVDSSGHFTSHNIHFKLNFGLTFDDEEDNDYYVKEWTNSDKKTIRSDRKFGGMKKIDLKWNRNDDATFTKEAYSFDAFRNEGILAQHTNLIRLTLKTDSDEKTMIYQAYEAIDKNLLKYALPGDTKGDLYKCTYNYMGKADLTTSDMNNKIGVDDKTHLYAYSLKTNEKNNKNADSAKNFTSLKNFINLVNTKTISGEEYYNNIKDSIYLNSFIKYSALCWVLGLPDDLRNNANNYYIYFYSGKALFMPFDNDRVLGIRNGWDVDLKNVSWDDPYAKGYNDFNKCPLILRFISGGSNNSHKVYQVAKDLFHTYCVEYANKYLDLTRFENYTKQFVNAPSKDINQAGSNNDTFALYASAKKATLN